MTLPAACDTPTMPRGGRPSRGIFFAIELIKQFFVATIFPLIFSACSRYNAIDVRSDYYQRRFVPPPLSRPDIIKNNDGGNWTTTITVIRSSGTVVGLPPSFHFCGGNMTQQKPTHRPDRIKCGYRNCHVMFVPNPKKKSHVFHSANCRVREWQCRHFVNDAEIDRLKKRIAELETGSDNPTQ